jgi:hypothetical protein
VTGERRPPARAVAALLASFGVGVWLGSARTLRRVRHLSDLRNRKWLKRQLKRQRRDKKKSHPLHQLLR